MEHDSKDPKGKIGKYNEIPVKQRDYYYDRHETDKDIQKKFGDMLADLKDMNKKMKKETEKEQTPKLKIDMSEGLLARAQWLNDTEEARKQYDGYKKAGGKKNFEGFLKASIKAVQDGKDVRSGEDVARVE